MNTAEMLVKTLQGKRLSYEERIFLLKWLVSEKTEMLLTRQLLILTHSTKSQVVFQLIVPLFSKNTNQIIKYRI